MLGRKLSVSDGAGSNEATKYYGIYRAKCLNNNDPDGLNKILVHIYSVDGEFNYNEESHRWVPVLSPYGGVPQMGLFMLPPIHADGYVIFEGGNSGRPVWIGSYPFADRQIVDEEASQEAGYTVMRIEPTIPPEMGGDASRIVLKTQYPSIDNPDQKDNKNKIENLIVMDESKLQLLHLNQSAFTHRGGGVSKGQPSSSISLSDSSIRLGVKTVDGKENYIEISNAGIEISVPSGESINLSEGKIAVTGNKESKIKISSPNGGIISINGQRVILDGEKIISGPPGATGGGGAVTNDCICALTGLPTHIGSVKTIVGG